VEERERAPVGRRLVKPEAAHIVRGADERLVALHRAGRRLRRHHHALAGLRAEHESLRAEYERVSGEFRERCLSAEGRQQLAVQQLESLVLRLRQ
jgi:hypothetical protein